MELTELVPWWGWLLFAAVIAICVGVTRRFIRHRQTYPGEFKDSSWFVIVLLILIVWIFGVFGKKK